MEEANHRQSIEIFVNGDRRTVCAGMSIAQLIEELDVDPTRIAVELDLQILPRARWTSTPLASGSRVEIVHFVGGG